MIKKEMRALADALVGQTPWGVQLGWGSFLTFEFGRPIEEDGTTHGEWHLWLRMCNWRVETATGVMCCSGDDPAYIKDMLGKCAWGQAHHTAIDEPGLDFEISFNSGHVVRTFISSSTDENQWMLYSPNGMVMIAHGGGRCEYLPQ
jgi:hypothetical protein